MLILGHGPQPTEPPHIAADRVAESPLDDTDLVAQVIAPTTSGDAAATLANGARDQGSIEPATEVVGDGGVGQSEPQVQESLAEPASEPIDNPVAIAQAVQQAPTVKLPEGMFDGAVRLTVFSQGNMQRVVKFVDALGQRPQFRVLRMTGNPQQEAAEIDIGLREPVPLLEILSSMGHLVQPEGRSNDGTPRLLVKLGTAATK
ncbi:MAG: hypothetical protein O3B65_02055 [Chloroflexi bacterium]|nr:hypothetical protein [Chloroflexota bacterium]